MSRIGTSLGRSPVLLLVLAIACGGGGGGGGGDVITDPPPGVRFDRGTPPANSVFLAHGNPGQSDTFRLEVRTRSVEDLYAVAFDLLFPGRVLEFDGAVEGPLLSTRGVPTTLQVSQTASGRMVVGLSRLGSVGGVDGSGTLLELEFRIVAGGTGELAFENRRAFDPEGRVKPDVSWVGGVLTVTR